MENIYSKDTFEQNSIVDIPGSASSFAETSGNTLYSWLGSMWRSIHKGDSMIRGIQKSRGIRLAQLCLDIIEASHLHDRNAIPVFHRELWHPIVIRKSERDTSQENMLTVGMDADIGPQPEGSEYGEGTVLAMGKLAQYEKYVTYPLHSANGKIVAMSKSIVDNIINPSVVLENEVDFVFRNNSIIFPKDQDPLSQTSPYEKYDIPSSTDDPNDVDIECVLWASDVLIDRDYIANHLSYALGANAPSSDIVKRIVNSAWDAVTSGLAPGLLNTFIAAMLNVPVIQNDTETVTSIDIETDDDEHVATIVRTDKETYRVSSKAVLRKEVFAGAILAKGTPLDESFRIYSHLNNDHMRGVQSYSVPLEMDLPSIVIPSDIIRVNTKFGLYTLWGRSVVKRADSNPNHLWFDIGGAPDDVLAFWNDVWDKADSDGVDLSKVIGKEGSIICPAEFVLKNLVGANTIFLVIDTAMLDDPSFIHDPMFFGMMSSVTPSMVRLFVVEHRSVNDSHNMNSSGESAKLSATLPVMQDSVSEYSTTDSIFVRIQRPDPVKVASRY